MIHGPSGLLSICPPWAMPEYESTNKKTTWPNGAIAFIYSSYEPDQLRGQQFEAAWCDELANNGGDLVKEVLKTASGGKIFRFRDVNASRGKYARAEPISALYEQGRVHYAPRGHLPRPGGPDVHLTGWTPWSGPSPTSPTENRPRYGSDPHRSAGVPPAFVHPEPVEGSR